MANLSQRLLKQSGAFITGLWKKNYIPFILIPAFGILTTLLLYGSPLKRIPLWIAEDGLHLEESIQYQVAVADSMSFPRFVSEYNIYFKYLSEDPCFKNGATEASLRIEVKKDAPFAQYAKRVFSETSCDDSSGTLPQFDGSFYHFCIKVNSNGERIPYPADKPISFATFLVGGGPAGSGCFYPHNALSYNDIQIYAKQSWTAWLLNLLAVSIIYLFFFSSLLGLMDRIRGK